ncbi:hypothetical protein GCM10009530_37980 [Microbispora corallina]|uniref:Uncharacterized protein n=1 Tax=Microbispora corallina TaxID=83302 RepID=A0ABQ4G2F2_9ACTN|nr:hypothetical protein Mco01_42470 [Microbispora corallina]
MENSHGNCEKPPRSPTTDGTAVAMIVLSSATRPVQSMMAASTGPRSDLRPTPVRVVAVVTPYPRRPVTHQIGPRAAVPAVRNRHAIPIIPISPNGRLSVR